LTALEESPRPPGAGIETGPSLVQLTGQHAGQVMAMFQDLSALAGPVNVPANGQFTTSAPLGASLRSAARIGPWAVVTLTLHVAGTPGVYTLGLAEATYTALDNQSAPLTPRAPFTITVQGP
jgi:hypothetical protein